MIIDEYLSEIHNGVGDPIATKPVPPERYEQFAGIFPPLLLRLWREYGFAGFCDGRGWLCDPVEWQPAVDAWTDGLIPHLAMGPDTWHAITRTAFGELSLWGERTGRSLAINPVLGNIYPMADSAQRMSTENDRNLQIYAVVLEFPDEDLLGYDDKEMFDQALKAHGPVGPDTMYTFVPTYHFGGSLKVTDIEIADAITHVVLLSDIAPHTLMTDLSILFPDSPDSPE